MSCEATALFALLEGGAGGAREAADTFAAMFASVREPWLARALLQYHERTGSARALELLARAPEPHARHLLDLLHDQLRGERPARRAALAALAPLVARRPAWLHRLAAHPLARDLVRTARDEREPLPLLHALLALAALLPAAPALAAPHLPELADALLRPAAPEPPAPRAHLQLARLALFRALYATHPCSLLDALRAGHAAAPGGARDAWERAARPLLESVRLHPALVTGSRQREADAARWPGLELHDVVAECRRLSLPAPAPSSPPSRASPAPRASLVAPPPAAPGSPAPGSGAHAARAASSLRPGVEPWFPLGERCGADSAPQTPLPADADAAEPPEAAVEATPENTPAKETRAQFRFPAVTTAAAAGVGVVPAAGGRRSQPPSPLRKETSPSVEAGGVGGRLARLALDRAAFEADGGRRRAAESPVPFGGAPPPAGAAVARPEPSRPPLVLDAEDREVIELTTLGHGEESWPEGEGAAPPLRVRDPRAAPAPPLGCATPGGAPAAPPRRPGSCPPPGAAPAERCIAVQTVDAWPEPYEFLIADYFRSTPADLDQASEEAATPSERLDAYLAELYSGSVKGRGGEAREQLALAHAQLMYERWRREAHAERNRRLLGRCRQVRALELQNAALRERLRAAARERDELSARLARDRPGAGAGGEPGAGALAAMEAALVAERGARARAEAALREAEAARAAAEGSLQLARGEAAEAARQLEALAHAALGAERRAEHVRRLRRELLLLAEREARLSAAAARALRDRSDTAAHFTESGRRALTERAAAAVREAEAAGARAEAAAAHARALEAQLAARGALLAELERAARRASDEDRERLRALQDKYKALMRTVRAAEAQRLRYLAREEMGAGGGARAASAASAASTGTDSAGRSPGSEGGAAGAGGAALAASGRVRSLLELQDAADAGGS